LKKRCAWVNLDNPLYIQYHDKEWGRPLKSSQKLFELLCLEGMQAGLSWETILNRREDYREVFMQFDPEKLANLSDKKLEQILQNPKIIRNKRKVYAIRQNARAYLDLSKKQSFRNFIWSYVNHQSIVRNPKNMKAVPTSTKLSKQMAKDLKNWGFAFVGETICYAFMQSAGLVDDHTTDCWLKNQ